MDSNTGIDKIIRNSSLYREFQAERDEIMKHKWIESEKAGYDIGFEHALTDWIINHRRAWRKSKQKQAYDQSSRNLEESSSKPDTLGVIHLPEKLQGKCLWVCVYLNKIGFEQGEILPCSAYQHIPSLVSIVGRHEIMSDCRLQRVDYAHTRLLQGSVLLSECTQEKNRCTVYVGKEYKLVFEIDDENTPRITQVLEVSVVDRGKH